MSNPMNGPRWRMRLMYQPHPNRETLFAGNPTNLVTATQNIQPIEFDDLLEMRQIVWELRDCIADWKPHLLPFFATGGIPYLIPVMEVFRRQANPQFIDGKHFHLFPGLTWGGTITGKSSEKFFATSFGDVLRMNQGGEPLRVLVIDTTNSGNAVNKAVAACGMAVESSGVSRGSIMLRFIGIVNSTHDEAKRESANKTIVTGIGKTAYVLTPSGYIQMSPLIDRQFTQFSHPASGLLSTLEVSYWLAGNIPTEDNAELIGVEAVHESLTTTSEPRAGRLRIVYGNGESQQGTGLGNLPGRLISLLSLSLDDWQWGKMRDINSLPSMTPEEQETLAEVKELSDGGLRLFELMSMDSGEAIDELAKLPRLLSDVEVYWLGTQKPPPKRIARKVRAFLEKQSCTTIEALKYFRLGFPELATGDPGDDSSAAWWDSQMRSMSIEGFLDNPESCDSVNGCVGVDASIDANSDFSASDDLTLDFVVVVGGCEEARRQLTELKSKGMSLEDIENHLNETWPVTADKALKFLGPTNEQVAMNFVLDCGGWQQASDCLEKWIEKNE